MPSWQTKRYCVECVGRLIDTLNAHDDETHFDLASARLVDVVVCIVVYVVDVVVVVVTLINK